MIAFEKKETGQNLFATRSLVTMSLFTAILCVSAYISFALPNGTHVTFLNFMITLVALVFPLSQSFTIVFVWMCLGCIGIPVFIGGGAGIGYLLNAWGGYTVAFLLIAVLIPLTLGKNYHRVRATIVSVASAFFVDIFGMLWLMIGSGLSLKQAIIPGFLSFIFLDIVKAVIVAQIAPAFRNILAINTMRH